MSILIGILVIGLLIAIHELGHYWAARLMGMKVIRYSIGFARALVKWTSKKSGTTYQIGVIPLGGFVQIKGMNPFEEGAFEDPHSYQNKSAWRRAIVILAGPAANFILAFVLLSGLYTVGVPEQVDEARVGNLVSGDPAEKAGLKKDDVVLQFNGEQISTWGELAGKLHENPEKEVELLISRNGSRMLVSVTPKLKNGIGLIGIEQPTKQVSLPFGKAVHAAFSKCIGVIAMTINSLGRWISREDTNVSPVGIVGIVKMTASSIESGAAFFFSFVSYLSLMLFMFNLFPIPALDGGRGIFLLFEIISRRRINKKFDAIVNTVGFFLLLGLLLAITAKELILG